MEGRGLMVGGGTGVAEAAGSATGVGGREPPEMRKTVAQGGSLPLSDRGGVEGGRRMPAGVLGAGGGGGGWMGRGLPTPLIMSSGKLARPGGNDEKHGVASFWGCAVLWGKREEKEGVWVWILRESSNYPKFTIF